MVFHQAKKKLCLTGQLCSFLVAIHCSSNKYNLKIICAYFTCIMLYEESTIHHADEVRSG